MVEEHDVGDPEDFIVASLLDTTEISTHKFLLLHFSVVVLVGVYFHLFVFDLSQNVIASHK